MIIILMGVCGSGKTSVGQMLSKALNFQFIEGDSFHSDENINKMSKGKPLTESDRVPWLQSIRKEMDKNLFGNVHCVITCSALSQKSREILMINQSEIKLIYLHAPKTVLAERMAKRKNHFMPPGLLDSQLEVLEEPDVREAMHVRVDKELNDVVNLIINELKSCP